MKINAWCLTDTGLRREANQDSSLVRPELGLYIVADGMGGHSGGEVASQMAVEIVAEQLQSQKKISTKNISDILAKAYQEASNRIYDFAAYEQPNLMGMGTTMVLACLVDDELFIGNVGDSRCYLYSNPYLWQLTEDHSLVNEHVRSGSMTETQAKNLVGKNVITRSVGYERNVIADFVERKINPGEVYLLCSDGLSGLVSDLQITEILKNHSAQEAVKVLVDAALANGGDDNVTVILLEVVSE